jgi:phosphoglycerol transferase
VLEFSNPTGCKTIEIDVPSPVSQKELGVGPDERKLGIGLIELHIARL